MIVREDTWELPLQIVMEFIAKCVSHCDAEFITGHLHCILAPRLNHSTRQAPNSRAAGIADSKRNWRGIPIQFHSLALKAAHTYSNDKCGIPYKSANAFSQNDKALWRTKCHPRNHIALALWIQKTKKLIIDLFYKKKELNSNNCIFNQLLSTFIALMTFR